MDAKPPYYAVIFSSRLADDTGYRETSDAMVALGRAQPGFLGIESARGVDGHGITISYWASLEAIAAWKAHVEHRAAQREGRDRFYERYQVRVARVDRAYAFEALPT